MVGAMMFLSSCVSRRELSVGLPANLPPSTSISVRIPQNGVYGDTIYSNSGSQVAHQLVAALLPYFPETRLVYETQARGLLLSPQILHWEDRATEWSGKRDRVEISLPLYANDGRLLGSALISANSSYWTMGGDHPEDLLQRPFKVYAASLAGIPYRDRLVIQK